MPECYSLKTDDILWRGSLLPLGRVAAPLFLGLLRSPTGINPLATGDVVALSAPH